MSAADSQPRRGQGDRECAVEHVLGCTRKIWSYVLERQEALAEELVPCESHRYGDTVLVEILAAESG